MDNKTGLPLLEIFLNSGTFVISEDDTLKTETKGVKKSTAFKSNGVERKSILIFLQYLASSLYSFLLNLSYFENNSNCDFVFSFFVSQYALENLDASKSALYV